MEKYGIASKLIALQATKTIIGICGGYQMLNINGAILELMKFVIESPIAVHLPNS